MTILFEWDENKALENFKKHGISFEEGKTIFNDPFLVTYPDEVHSDKEERLISIGASTENRLLLAVHTEREQNEIHIIIRIISCRKATALERRVYEENED